MHNRNANLRIIEKQIRFNAEWIKHSATVRMREDALSFLSDDLKSGGPGAALNAADSLSRLASFVGAEGQVEVFNEDSVSGWEKLYTSATYLGTATKLRYKVFQQGVGGLRSLETEVGPCALSLCWNMVISDMRGSDTYAKLLRLMISNPNVVRNGYWDHHFVGVFALELFNLLSDGAPVGRSLGPYQPIRETWDGATGLEEAIIQACDEHCSRMEDKSERFSAEFRHPPFDILPVEIIAIRTVRTVLGLGTPPIDHPLLSSCLSDPPLRSASHDSFDVLEKVEKAFLI